MQPRLKTSKMTTFQPTRRSFENGQHTRTDHERHARARVTDYELMQECISSGLCEGKEEEAINRFLKEGRVPVDVAVALFGIIGRQKYLSKPTIH